MACPQNLAPAQRLERGVATLAFEEVVATPAGTESAADPVRAAIVHGLLGKCTFCHVCEAFAQLL